MSSQPFADPGVSTSPQTADFAPVNSKIVPIHPAVSLTQPDAPSAHIQTSERLAKPPGISVRLDDMSRIVFLITDLQDLPELDVHPVDKCTMRFHLLPGLLVGSREHQIVCPLLPGHRTLFAQVQLLLASIENENPFYGLSMYAKVTALPEYMDLVPPEISIRLPYDLVQELFPNEAASIKITDDMIPHSSGVTLSPERVAALKQQIPIPVHFALPCGHPLPELYRGKIVRISLSLHVHTGGLALNRTPLPINSLSRPTRIHAGVVGFDPPADDYYQLQSIGRDRPVTSQLPSEYEDYAEMLDPTAALLERRGFKP